MGTEAGSYLRLIDSCITQLKAQGPSRICTESKENQEWFREGVGTQLVDWDAELGEFGVVHRYHVVVRLFQGLSAPS